MDIFVEFHAVTWGNYPKNSNIKYRSWAKTIIPLGDWPTVQWVVVIILLVFSTKENMFVGHTENMMMDIFWEFHAVAWGNNPKNCNIK